jgi:hypothetical protein
METVRWPVEVAPAEERWVSGAIVSVVPEKLNGEPGVRVTCTASVETIARETECSETRRLTIRRTSDPVEWNHVYTTYGMTGGYLGAGKGVNWSQSVGLFTETRKFTWRGVFAPSRNVGFFPVGKGFRNSLANDPHIRGQVSDSGPRVMPYTLGGGLIHETDFVPALIYICFDTVSLAVDIVSMGVAGVCDVVNLGLLKTTLPASYDVVTMTGAAVGDGVCLTGVTVADTAASAVALIPNALCGLGDALYPAAFKTNVVVVSRKNGVISVGRAPSTPDYSLMSVTLLAGDRLVRKSLDRDGSVWIGIKDMAATGGGELMLWDDRYRVWGERKAVVSAAPAAKVSVRPVASSLDWWRYRK